MAAARGRWLVDQTSARFGAWTTAAGAGPSVTCVVLVVDAGGGEGGAASNCRAVVLKGVAAARFESCRAAVATRRRETNIVLLGWVVVVGGGWFRDRDPEVELEAWKRQLTFNGLAASALLAGAPVALHCGRRRLNLGAGQCSPRHGIVRASVKDGGAWRCGSSLLAWFIFFEVAMLRDFCLQPTKDELPIWTTQLIEKNQRNRLPVTGLLTPHSNRETFFKTTIPTLRITRATTT
jgi:hypothetical protein